MFLFLFFFVVEFSNGALSTKDVDNPNNLKPDYKNTIFKGFSALQVNICHELLKSHVNDNLDGNIYLLSTQIFHVPQTAELGKTLIQRLSEFKLYPITSSTLQMVCSNAHHGFYTTSIRMKKPHITDLKLHYGADFPKIHSHLLEILQDKNSTGITFLHGPPGTGKTYYLRYLINEIKDKNLIYIPPDLVNVSQRTPS